MSQPVKSRIESRESAKDALSKYAQRLVAERATNSTPANPVRFHAGGYALAVLRSGRHGNTSIAERIIRFSLHNGQAIEVALAPGLAVELGGDLLTKGGAA